jgi:hypothetical protein
LPRPWREILHCCVFLPRWGVPQNPRVYVAEVPFGDHLLSPALLALRTTLLQSLAPYLDSSDEIAFAQFNTAVPQDVVGRGAVEIKVGQHEMHQIRLAFKTQRVLTKG